MFDKLMENIITERNNLLDKLTMELIRIAGFELPVDYSTYDIFALQGEMQKEKFRIRLQENEIALIKLEDFSEKVLCGYKLVMESDNNSITIKAVSI